MIVVTTHDSLEPIRGGGAVRTLKLATELKLRGEEVLIIAPSEKDKIDDIPLLKLPPLTNKASLFGMLYYSFKLSYFLVLNSKSISGVWAHNAASGIVAVVYCMIFKKKIVLDVTDIHSGYMKIDQNNFLKKRILQIIEWLEFFAFRNSNQVIVATEFMKQVIQKRGVNEKNIVVIYDGVDTSIFREKYNITREIPLVVHHGGMEKQDGVDLIIKSASILKKKNIYFRYILAGGSLERKEIYKKLTIEYQVEELFDFPDWMPFADLVDLLRSSDIGIISRTKNLPNQTVTTLKLLEYMSVGLIPVVPDLMGIKEVCTDSKNSLIYIADDPESLANTLEVFKSKDILMSDISLNARKSVMDFEWTNQIDKIASVTIKTLNLSSKFNEDDKIDAD